MHYKTRKFLRKISLKCSELGQEEKKGMFERDRLRRFL
jgi:hypothetical protein